jgi:uroporphyrinogen-III decarboxylase
MLTEHDWRAVYDVHRLIGSIHHRGPIGVGYRVAWDGGWDTSERVELGAEGRVIRHHTMHTPRGDLTSKYVYHVIPDDPLVGKWVEYPVKEAAEWDIYQAYLEELIERSVEPALGTVEEAHRTMGDEGVASVGVGSSFGRLGNARGMQDLLLDMYDHPDRLAAVTEVSVAYQEKILQAFLASPSEVTFYDICWATGARMGPRLFEQWVLPEVQRAVEVVHAVPNKYIGLYTLGPIGKLLPMLVEAGVDYIETFEPNQGDISLAEAKRLYGDRVCLMGNFDCLVLARGTVRDAQQETLRCLREGMEGGGYVLVTGDEVPADAKLENLRAMVETVQEHGVY